MKEILQNLKDPELRQKLALEELAERQADQQEEMRRRKRSGVDKRRQELLRQRY